MADQGERSQGLVVTRSCKMLMDAIVSGCPDAKWRNAESGMQHFVDEDGTIKGIVEPVELPGDWEITDLTL